MTTYFNEIQRYSHEKVNNNMKIIVLSVWEEWRILQSSKTTAEVWFAKTDFVLIKIPYQRYLFIYIYKVIQMRHNLINFPYGFII